MKITLRAFEMLHILLDLKLCNLVDDESKSAFSVQFLVLFSMLL